MIIPYAHHISYFNETLLNSEVISFFDGSILCVVHVVLWVLYNNNRSASATSIKDEEEKE